VGGGISAYKTPELVRALEKRGIGCRVILTQAGSQFVTPLTLASLTKDDVHQDSTVKVSAMKEMFSQISTPAAKKRAVALPNTGNHVIGSYIKSKDLQSVEEETLKFTREILLKD
jgi:phosphopantothenoylcysteine synthetase/decarboxylase